MSKSTVLHVDSYRTYVDACSSTSSYMNEEHEETSYTLRIGSLVLHNVGQLLPHQLQSAAFHNRNFIYPVR
jgi:hypothetical protein